MKTDLRARLKNDATVAGLVSTRIDWAKRPQGSALPAITLQRISEQRPQHMGGNDNLKSARVQIDIWAEKEATLTPIEDAVLVCLVPEATQGATKFFRSFVDAIRDMPAEAEVGALFRTSIDLKVHYSTT